MANAISLMNMLKNPKLSSSPDDTDDTAFLQGQGGANALPSLVPVPAQAQGTLTNPVGMTPDPERTPASMEDSILGGPINKTSDSKTNQNITKQKTYSDEDQWNKLISQASGSAPIAAEQSAIDAQKAQADAYAQRMAGRDTNNYTAIGAMADNLNSINGTKSNFAEALEKQAALNDPKKIQDEILKNFADVTKAQQGVGTNTLSAVKDMASGDTQNKAIDAQMQGLQAFNPSMINSRNVRQYETAQNNLLNDPQLKALGGYIRSVGNGINQLGANTLPNTVAELQNIANSVAGAGSGLSAAERSEMGLNNLGTDLTKVQNYLSGPQAVEGGLQNPIVQQLIERIKTEHAALTQYFNSRGEARVNNNTPLYNLDPSFEKNMRGTWQGMQNSVQFTPQAAQIEAGNNPPPMGGAPQVKNYTPGMTIAKGDLVKDPKTGAVHQYVGGDVNNSASWKESK